MTRYRRALLGRETRFSWTGFLLLDMYLLPSEVERGPGSVPEGRNALPLFLLHPFLLPVSLNM